MHRIDSDGNVAGLYTNGVPSIQEATVADANAQNAIQEELAYLVEREGVTLLTSTDGVTQTGDPEWTQVGDALDTRYGRKGTANTWTGVNTFNGNVVTAGSLTTQAATINGTLEANGNINLNNDVSVNGAVSASGDVIGSTLATSGTVTAGSLTIEGVNPASTTNIANKLTLANMVKVLVIFTADAAGPIFRDGAHIASIANENANQVRVTFASSFASAYYACSFESDNSNYEPRAVTKNAAYVIVGAKDNSGAVAAIGSGAAVGVTVGMTIVGRQ